MTSTPQQEIQEMQEMQERPVGATEGTMGCGAEPRQEHQSANQPISEALHGAPRDTGAPGKRATDEDSGKSTRRETEGGGRGQRRSRRAPDGARSGSRLLLRLCGKAPPFSGRLCRPSYPHFQQSYKQWLIKLSVIGTVINAFYRIIDKVINSG